MENSGNRTIIEKIAYVLHSQPDQFDYLKGIDYKSLEDLHNRMVKRVYAETNPAWEKLAAVAKFMPNFINAKISEDILGADITAQLSYHLPVNDAIGVSRSLSTPFLARVVERLIPEKAVSLIVAYPMRELLKIVEELLKQRKHYTLGTFVDFLPHDKLHSIAREIRSEHDLMKIGVYASRKDHLAGMLEGFSDDRILGLLRATEELNLWADILEIMTHFSDAQRKRFAVIFDQIPADSILNLVRVGAELRLLEYFLAIMVHFTDDQKLRLAKLVPDMNDDVLLEFVRNATTREFTDTVLSISERLDISQFHRAGPLLKRLSEDEMEKLARFGYELRREKTVFLFLKFVPAEDRASLINVFSRFSVDERDDIARMAQEAGVFDDLQYLF